MPIVALSNWLSRRFRPEPVTSFPIGLWGMRAIGLVLALLTLSSAGVVIWNQHRVAIEDASLDMQNLGAVLAEQTSRYVQAIDIVLQDVQTRSRELGIHTPEEFRHRMGDDDTQHFLLQRMQNLPHAHTATLFDTSGAVINSTLSERPTFNVADRPSFQYLRDHPESGLLIREPAMSRGLTRVSLFLNRRISGPDGGFLGVVGISINVEYLRGFYKSITHGGSFAVTLLRNDGVILVHYPPVKADVTAVPAGSPWYAYAAAGSGTYLSTGTLRGFPSVVAVTQVPSYPLVLNSSIPQVNVLRGWRQVAASVAVAAILLTGALIALFWTIARQMRRQQDDNIAITHTANQLRQAKERAERAEALLQDAIDSIHEGFVIFDAEERLVAFNDMYRQIYPDHAPWLTIGMPVTDILRHARAGGLYADDVGPDEEWIEARLRRYRERTGGTELPLRDGQWLLVTNRRMRNGGTAGLRVNITTLKQTEAALRESEARLERAQEIAGIGSWELDLTSGRYLMSRQLLRILGLPPDFQATDASLTSLVATEGGIAPCDWMAGLKTGHARSSLEFQITRPDGETRVLNLEGRPVAEADGTIRRLTGTAQDITERRQIENQLLQAQKMEAVGALTGGMAHDFNNVLGVIIGNLDLLKRLIEPASMASELCDDALDGATRCADLIQHLLAFARRQPLRPTRIDVNTLVTDTARLLGRTIGEDITVLTSLDPTAGSVTADATQLESALVNLATNARDAMPKGGELHIATKSIQRDAPSATFDAGVPAGDYVVIEVVDTGSGIPPEIIGRIFEPFYTTKEQGKGTGLGLSMIFGFVKQSGGHIAVSSDPGKGTTFRIYLPSNDTTEIASPVTTAPNVAISADETVLLVEDNSLLRQATRRQLMSLGYQVREAEHAAAAMTILAGGDPVDLLFTDLVMPGSMDGLALVRQALRLRPDLRVLVASGFPGGRNADRRIADCPFPFLEKPYRRDDLARMVRAALDRPGP